MEDTNELSAWASFENEHREKEKDMGKEEEEEERKRRDFLWNLYDEILEDVYAVDPELGACGVFVRKHPDGTFVAEPFDYGAARDGPDARKDESLSLAEEDCGCCVEEARKRTAKADGVASFEMEDNPSFSRSSSLVPQIRESVTESLSPMDEDGDCCVGEQRKRTSTAGEISRMENNASFWRSVTLVPETCELMTEATPLLQKSRQSSVTQSENSDTSPVPVIMCGCQCS